MKLHSQPVRIRFVSGAVAGLVLAWALPATAARVDGDDAARSPTLAVFRSITAHLSVPATGGNPSVTLGLRN